ncbi:Sec-independent protein translocase subunit TatA [Nocardiopsis sp. EMB25]|uniref:Sec-independent protein translocase subunit TatA n=1 Tax=Nocardiopsis sp. EMB25 TaxID=2835867 RepID=UPI002284D66E|nr:Sec-independent protein translocase subunit TatA [Nocardiopsis sp. EMB25]MCY9783228.1 Sec-independent protein translocase subunit TatA [Nocardiopsis sp. EMB25]
MGAINGPTIAILVVLAVLLFGAKKLPDLARSVGRSARILKAESKGLIDEENNESGDDKKQQEAPQTAQRNDAEAQHQGYPQLPPGQRIVNESGEPQPRTYGN